MSDAPLPGAAATDALRDVPLTHARPSLDVPVPLFDRGADDTVLIENGGPVSRRDIEARVQRLARRLVEAPTSDAAPASPPDAHAAPVRYALNLCDDRRHFLTAFAAVIAAGFVNLLPPNRQRSTIAGLVERYADVFIVHDGSVAGLELPCAALDVRPAANQADGAAPARIPVDTTPGRETQRPSARRDALAAISFTSGSTGVPGANLKRWGALIDGTAINARAMLQGLDNDPRAPLTVLATVPPQHMYGLELSVLLPMRAPVCVANGQPLYPADVCAALSACAQPRALVTTPAHLRALTAAALPVPSACRVFSATAPLSDELARRTESAFAATLVEIYGCSEVGSVARRQSARDTLWEVFDGLALQAMSSTCGPGGGGTSYRVVAEHLDAAPELQDALEIVAPRRFRLAGRQGDLLNIAGKRGSLAEITRLLLQAPDVVDAVAFQAEQGRLVAIVVAPPGRRHAIIAALRTHLDPVFLPRPLLFAERLPRQASSKLLASDVQALYARLSGQRERAER